MRVVSESKRPAAQGQEPISHIAREGTPRYVALAHALQEGIGCGRFPVGTLLPTEMMLSETYGVSRQTVRRAIEQLRRQGLVSARKGVGTRVEAQRASELISYSALSATDLVEIAAGSEMTIERSDPIVARGALAAALGCRPNTRWLRLSSVRRIVAEALPFAIVHTYIDNRIAASVQLPRVMRSALFLELEKQSGETFNDITQDIRATMLDEATAARLEAVAGMPALEITRRFYGAGRRLRLVAVNTMPADRFFYSVAITRNS